jgi:GTP-binding protein HflX
LLVDDLQGFTLHLQPQFAKLRAQLFAMNAVEHEELCDDGTSWLKVRLSSTELDAILRRVNLRLSDVGLIEPPQTPEW